jgi:hypothetical protein
MGTSCITISEFRDTVDFAEFVKEASSAQLMHELQSLNDMSYECNARMNCIIRELREVRC